jgi:hypothetical protein
MPPVRLFGRSWHFSEDDLVLPGACGVIYHGAWCVVLLWGVIALRGGYDTACINLDLLEIFFVTLLVFFFISAVVNGAISGISLRGKRTHVHSHRSCILLTLTWQLLLLGAKQLLHCITQAVMLLLMQEPCLSNTSARPSSL